MPNPHDFLKAFNLQKKITLCPDAIIDDIEIHHITVQRYHIYEFPITLTVRLKKTSAGYRKQTLYCLQQALHKKSTEYKTVLSHYGNPYHCTLEYITMHIKDTETIEIVLNGRAERIYQ